MVRRSLHAEPFRGTWRDALQLARAYRIPLLVLTMIASFAVGFNVFLLHALDSLHVLRGSATVTHDLFPGWGVVLYLVLGDGLFALLFWCFVRAMLTCPGYVPHEPWRHPPRFDASEQRRVSEQWTKQQRWLEWNRYVQAVQQYQWRMRLMQTFVGVSVPAMHLMPPTAPAQGIAGSTTTQSPVPLPLSSAPSHSPGSHSGLPSSAVAPAAGWLGNPPQHPVSGTPSSAASTSRDKSSSSTRSSSTSSSGSCVSDTDSSGGGEPPSHETRTQQPRQPSMSKPQHSTARCDEPPHVSLTMRDCAAPRPRERRREEDGANPFTVLEWEADGSLRYCHPCGQYKPDRSHHCRICERCVCAMDHHCFFLYNCVGLRNYKYFFLTISYGTACGWLCALMQLHVYHALAQTHTQVLQQPLPVPLHFSGPYVEFQRMAASVRHAATFSLWWLLTPVCMLLVNLLVFPLWWQHVGLLRRGQTTLERMRQVSVERFMRNMDVLRYGRWAPQTNRLCAILVEVKEHARCMLHSAPPDEEQEYAKMLAREEAGDGISHGDANAKSLTGLEEASRRPRDAAAATATSGAATAAERGSRHVCRLFGQPAHWLHHALPLTPRLTGEQPGEAETDPRAAKDL